MKDIRDSDEWALEVGLFVLAFGRIELCTYWLLEDLAPKELTDYFRAKQVLERVDVGLKLVEAREGEEWKELAAVLGEVKSLLAHRRLIAHNDLWIEVLTGEALQQRIVSGRNVKNTIDFEALTKKRIEAQELAERFMNGLSSVLLRFRGYGDELL